MITDRGCTLLPFQGVQSLAIAMASPSEIWCKDTTFLCSFQKTSQLFLPIFGSSERFCTIMHDTARYCTIAVEQARSVTHLSLLYRGSLQNCTGQNNCSKNRSGVQKFTPVVSKSTVVVFKTYGVKSEVILTNICYLYRKSSKVI